MVRLNVFAGVLTALMGLSCTYSVENEPGNGTQGRDPALPVPEAKSSDLTIELAPDTPESVIVLGHTDARVPYTRYLVTNRAAVPVTFDHVMVEQANADGDLADVEEIAFELDGTLHASAPFVTGSQVTVLELQDPFRIPAESTATLVVTATMNPVQPMSVGEGVRHGFARSGHTPSLRILQASADNGHITVEVPDHAPNPMLLRKSKPVLEYLEVPPLVEGENTLVRMKVTSDPIGPVAVRQLVFQITLSEGLGANNDRLAPFWIAAETAPAWSEIVRWECLTDPECHGRVLAIIKFERDVVVDGEHPLWVDLKANVTEVTPRATATTSLYAYPIVDHKVITGSLMFDEEGRNLIALIPGVGPWSSGLMWSDLSEDPHTGALPSSQDYTNTYLMPERNAVVTITAP